MEKDGGLKFAKPERYGSLKDVVLGVSSFTIKLNF
jgi:hypothetical protein